MLEKVLFIKKLFFLVPLPVPDSRKETRLKTRNGVYLYVVASGATDGSLTQGNVQKLVA